MSCRLREKYVKEIRPLLVKDFNYTNALQAPRMEKVVVSMGVKEGAVDIKIIDQAAQELSTITGQKPIVTRAKKAISAFKLRQGQPIGLKVTLRKERMYNFIDRLFNVAMPRIRDFRGFSPAAFDQGGNYNLGLSEQIIFPEIEYDKVKKIQGMNVTFVTTAKTPAESQKLLEYLGLPFRKKQE
jgi:large subunit ribosomal protein L5